MDKILQNLAPYFLSGNPGAEIPGSPPSQDSAFDPEELFSTDKLFPNLDEWEQIRQSHSLCRALMAGLMVQLDPVLRSSILSSGSLMENAPQQLAGEWLDRLERIARGPEEGQSKPVDLGQVLKAASLKLQDTMEAKKVLYTETLPERSISLHGQATLLHEMMEELLRNSLEALAGIEKDRQIGIELKASLKAVFITMSDNGEGISHETLIRMFFPFFTTRRQIGLGLFWICRALVHHQGRLKLWSRPGLGTEVYLRLPLENS